MPHENVVPALRVAATAGEGAPFVGGIFGVAVACAVDFGDQPGAAEVVLEAGDVFALVAAGRFSEQNERGEDAVVGGLGADVAAVDGIEADPEDDVAIVGGGQQSGQATGGVADDGDAG